MSDRCQVDCYFHCSCAIKTNCFFSPSLNDIKSDKTSPVFSTTKIFSQRIWSHVFKNPVIWTTLRLWNSMWPQRFCFPHLHSSVRPLSDTHNNYNKTENIKPHFIWFLKVNLLFIFCNLCSLFFIHPPSSIWKHFLCFFVCVCVLCFYLWLLFCHVLIRVYNSH